MAGPSSTDKKPRMRHSDIQLAALNDLYDQDEHPSLDERAHLAHKLGMEPKAVNAWFANKRSASKKKSRGLTANSPSCINPNSHSLSASASPSPPSFNHHYQHQDNDSSLHSTPMYYHRSLYPTDVEAQQLESPHRHAHEGDASGAQRRMRYRPTPQQREELERLFERNTHPSREDREALGDRIGMKYQTVTNWFQNMRSVAKKRMEEQDETQSVHSSAHSDYGSTGQHPPARLPFPTAASHPSLPSGNNNAPSGSHAATSHTHYSTPPYPAHSNSSAHPRRADSANPTTAAMLARPRRSRPEAYQLAALRNLFNRTQNPSIEERGALALEINMDIGKVTNWFRNLRQTARKRALKAQEEGDEESLVDYDSASGPMSRASTPPMSRFPSSHSYQAYPDSVSYSHSSSSASVDGDADRMDVDRYPDTSRPSRYLNHHQGESASHYRNVGGHDHYHQQLPHPHHHSDGGSEDDYEEAVTPPPAPAPMPPPPVDFAPVPRVGRNRMDVGFLTGSSDSVSSEDMRAPQPKIEKQEVQVVDGPRVEDAMLLLGFSSRIQ